MNILLTVVAWLLLASATVVGIVSFVRDGGIKEIIRSIKGCDD